MRKRAGNDDVDDDDDVDDGKKLDAVWKNNLYINGR